MVIVDGYLAGAEPLNTKNTRTQTTASPQTQT